MTTGTKPAASAKPWRSETFSLREAAKSTSTSLGELAQGPMTQKSRLTSAKGKGMYCVASDSTCSSISSSDSPAGSMMRLVITAEAGATLDDPGARGPRRIEVEALHRLAVRGGGAFKQPQQLVGEQKVAEVV